MGRFPFGFGSSIVGSFVMSNDEINIDSKFLTGPMHQSNTIGNVMQIVGHFSRKLDQDGGRFGQIGDARIGGILRLVVSSLFGFCWLAGIVLSVCPQLWWY